jgi:hypothetical protein
MELSRICFELHANINHGYVNRMGVSVSTCRALNAVVSKLVYKEEVFRF